MCFDSSNYTPFFTHGWSGFGASLLPLFFAYAGFESIAQTAGEVKDSTRRLPKILLKGITVTALFYVFTSIVSFGVLPGGRLQASSAPMAEVASIYLPAGAAIFVTIGAIAAIMTALNGTIFVPSRLAIMFVEDRSGAALARFHQQNHCDADSRFDADTDLLRDFADQRTACTRVERCSVCARRALFHS